MTAVADPTATPTGRPHGTYTRYVTDRCRCEPCRRANRDYERARAARVEPPYVSAAPAREHLQWLATQGVGLKTVARRSGVPHGTLSKLVYGDRTRGMAPSKRIRPATAERILAVTPADAADGAKVDAAPAWEVINRLVDAGVPKVAIARRLGQTSPGLQLSRNLISARHARLVAEMGRELDAGEFTYERRSRHGTVQVTVPAPPTEPDPAAVDDDRDRLLVELVELLEERVDQRSWRRSAACRGRPPWMWFPARGDQATLAAAKKVCASCTVREECLAANLGRTTGVYGGLSAKQRRRLRVTSEAAA